MSDKRLRLLLISIMSWQAVYSGSFVGEVEPAGYAVINIPGKEPLRFNMQKNGENDKAMASVEKYLKSVKESLDSFKKKMAKDVESYLAKFVRVNNDKSSYTQGFIDSSNKKEKKFNDDQVAFLTNVKNIEKKINDIDSSLEEWGHVLSLVLHNEERRILSQVDFINSNLLVILKEYTAAEKIMNDITNSITLFDTEAAKDKADEVARKARADKQKAEKVAADAQKAAAVAPNKTTVKAATVSQQDAEKAARNAEEAEKVAIQASVKLNEKRSTIFDENIAQNIQQIAQLRELMEGLLGRIDNLLKDIEFDSSRYSAEFIQDIGNKFKPDRDRIFKGFNSVITDIDNVLTEIKESNKNKKALEEKISETSNLIEKAKMDDEISKIVLTLGQLSNSSSNKLKDAEKYQRELSELFTTLLIEKQKFRKIYPAEVGRVLELSHVVKLEKNKMDMKDEARKRVEMQTKEDAVARVLNLFVAVKDQKIVKAVRTLELSRLVFVKKKSNR
ncbi:hypothetical protein HYV10_02500 [Candidatus Dependentiae bacterium]|nr:hypothetical protein [Candidatus Dependentiae bacterium]